MLFSRFLCGNPIPRAFDLNTRAASAYIPAKPRVNFESGHSRTAAGSRAMASDEDDEDVIQMNEARSRASDWVQRGGR